MLKLTECRKSFKKKKALDGFNLSIENGIFGLLGPNGAGKTTLMRCICGLYNIDSGKIEKSSKTIGYLPQKFGIFRELTVYEMMSYFATLKGIEKANQKEQIQQCIEEVNLTDRLYDRIATLSGGMIRRIGIAQAILGDPEIIIFDEPTAGLDPEERMRFKNLVVQNKLKNSILLISTHIVSDVEAVCDNILIMDHGKLIASGTGVEIANLAEEKVYLIDANNVEKLSGNYFIKDRIEESGVPTLRVLSREKQLGTLQSPTVEDGFLCALKKI